MAGSISKNLRAVIQRSIDNAVQVFLNGIRVDSRPALRSRDLWCKWLEPIAMLAGCTPEGRQWVTMSHRAAELERQLCGPNPTDFLLVIERPESAHFAR